MGNMEAAIVEQRELIRLNPHYSGGYSDLILYMGRMANLEEAVRVQESAARLNVYSPGFHDGLGIARLANGDADGARREFEQMKNTVGDNAARLGLSRVDVFQGKMAVAIEAIKADLQADELARIDRFKFNRSRLLAYIYALQGSSDIARRYADILTQTKDPLNFKAENLREAGIIYLELGDLAAALRILDLLRAIKDDSPAPITEMCFFVLRGQIALAGGDYSTAEDSFKAAWTAYPSYLSHHGLAQTYAATGDWRRATEEWKHVIERRGEIAQEGFPAEIPLAHLELARALEKMGDARRASAS